MLEDVRKLHGYTQEELASKIGISQNYYTQIESGKARSAPVISKLSALLKIKKSFLLSSGEYYEYPFLSDFYSLFLTDQRISQSYRFLFDYICSKSKYIDAVFFRRPKIGMLPFYQIIYMALLDDRQTLFFFRRRVKRGFRRVGTRSVETRNEEAVTFFPLADLFREELHRLQSTYIYERTVLVDDELSKRIESGTAERDDIITFFPAKNYYKELYKAHMEIRER